MSITNISQQRLSITRHADFMYTTFLFDISRHTIELRRCTLRKRIDACILPYIALFIFFFCFSHKHLDWRKPIFAATSCFIWRQLYSRRKTWSCNWHLVVQNKYVTCTMHMLPCRVTYVTTGMGPYADGPKPSAYTTWAVGVH